MSFDTFASHASGTTRRHVQRRCFRVWVESSDAMRLLKGVGAVYLGARGELVEPRSEDMTEFFQLV